MIVKVNEDFLKKSGVPTYNLPTHILLSSCHGFTLICISPIYYFVPAGTLGDQSEVMKTTTVYTGIVTLALYIEYNRFAMASLIGLRHLLNYLFGMHPFVFLLPRSNPIVGLEC